MCYPHKWTAISYGSSMGQRSLSAIGQRRLDLVCGPFSVTEPSVSCDGSVSYLHSFNTIFMNLAKEMRYWTFLLQNLVAWHYAKSRQSQTGTSDTPICQCGKEEHSVTHLVLHCDKYIEARSYLMIHLKKYFFLQRLNSQLVQWQSKYGYSSTM